MTDRERFEAWLVGRDGEEAIQKDAQGVYGYWDTRQSWDAWQASRRQALEDASNECNKLGDHEEDMGRELEARGCDACALALDRLANPEGEQG